MRRLILEEPYSGAALWSRRIATFALLVALIALVLARWDGIDRIGILYVLLSAAGLAVLGGIFALFGLLTIWRHGRKGFGIAVFSLFLAAAVLVGPAYFTLVGFRLPPINDISTDLSLPPEFSRSREALLLRGGRTPPDSSEATREVQRFSYPGIAPLILERTPDDAFALARQTARFMGWQIVDPVAPGGRMGTGIGRFDAVARSRFLRFTDDVAVRVRPQGAGARIDIRSVSRLGRHDFGANAARITDFLRRLKELDEEK